ncbi:hypothetical protein [Acidianus sp. RZ1]|uniref:hypothetical protein n=1 Tax=Acidianus sp. RZ1 TaxID=1540082 RepID=UPI0014930A72|nr:hypothetical protein [Acidianus sp. RZ1]NON63266.1 hypothetical protein [Acidianus sp. RZ1]
MVKKLIEEAVEEAEKFGSLSSMYFLVKKIWAEYGKLSREPIRDYDFTVDDIILFSLHRSKLERIPFFVSSFLTWYYLSNHFFAQDPLFYFRWDKRIFVYSPRVDAHLLYLARTGYVKISKTYCLTEKGKEESSVKLSSLGERHYKEIDSILNNVYNSKKLRDLRMIVKDTIFFR